MRVNHEVLFTNRVSSTCCERCIGSVTRDFVTVIENAGKRRSAPASLGSVGIVVEMFQ